MSAGRAADVACHTVHREEAELLLELRCALQKRKIQVLSTGNPLPTKWSDRRRTRKTGSCFWELALPQQPLRS